MEIIGIDDRDGQTVQEAGARGGKARAENMTAEERRDAARRAAEERWAAKLPGAISAGVLKLGNIECAVLEDGRRVLNQETFLLALGRSARPKAGTGISGGGQLDKLPPFLAARNLNPFIYEELRNSTTPIAYRNQQGKKSYGYLATVLPAVCKVYIDADWAGKIWKSQKHVVEACRILHESLSEVGIIALVDEATGYQYLRPRLELQEYLALYISKKLARWESTFPPDFYREVHRLKSWKYNEQSTARSMAVGRLTNDLVYVRLAPFVLEELKRLTPRNEKGRLKHKMFQHLTPQPGIKELKDHFKELLAIARGYDDGQYELFLRHMNRALPRQPQKPDLFSRLPEPVAGG